MNNTVPELQERLFTFLAEDNPKYSKLVLFGAGDTYQLYKKSIRMEELPFECILDNDPAKCTQSGGIDQELVYNARKYAEEGLLDGETLVLIVSNGRTRLEIQTQLDQIGVRNMPIDAFVLRRRRKEVMRVFDSLCDDLSKLTYANVLLARAGEQDQIPAEIYSPDAYYAVPAFLKIAEDDVFIDLGAYVGDTVETYVWKSLGTFGKIYAFEPEIRNAAALAARVERLNREWALDGGKIQIVHAGIGRRNGVMHVDGASAGAPSLGAKLNAGNSDGETVSVYSIDEFFRGKQEHISAIKADIESFEYDMLLGAEQIVKGNRPRLAICIYHGVSDLYTIPLLIKKYCPDYRLAVRHHSMTLADTVLYAYPS